MGLLPTFCDFNLDFKLHSKTSFLHKSMFFEAQHPRERDIRHELQRCIMLHKSRLKWNGPITLGANRNVNLTVLMLTPLIMNQPYSQRTHVYCKHSSWSLSIYHYTAVYTAPFSCSSLNNRNDVWSRLLSDSPAFYWHSSSSFFFKTDWIWKCY